MEKAKVLTTSFSPVLSKILNFIRLVNDCLNSRGRIKFVTEANNWPFKRVISCVTCIFVKFFSFPTYNEIVICSFVSI